MGGLAEAGIADVLEDVEAGMWEEDEVEAAMWDEDEVEAAMWDEDEVEAAMWDGFADEVEAGCNTKATLLSAALVIQ